MKPKSLAIWCNGLFSPPATRALEAGIRERGHTLITARSASASVLVAGAADPEIAQADVALGQPAPDDCLASRRLGWIEVTSAGYTRYDTPAFMDAMRDRKVMFSNMSGVFADPCAQHVLAMMLALGRQLLPSYRDQLEDQRWEYLQRRYDSVLLTGQTVVLLGFGAIGRRLAELLAPFRPKIIAVRRQVRSERGVQVVPEEQLSAVLSEADHVVNILPHNDSTENYVNARRLACCKRGACFYNVGRGATVDEAALAEALRSGQLAAAYLDVFQTEPLPRDHAFWTLPNCFITPHTAGGRRDQDEAIVRHFLSNLDAFVAGGELADRVI